MVQSLSRYFRCSNPFLDFTVDGQLSAAPGFFRFGPDAICYGRSSKGLLSDNPGQPLDDVSHHVRLDHGRVVLPFDPEEIIGNLRSERYAAGCAQYASSRGLIRDAYYLVRPLLPLAVRKYLQRIYLRGWEDIPFPKWPVDRTVDRLFQEFVVLALKSTELESIPFIWFWPDGANACAVMTHDVEAAPGKRFCSQLMDLDSSFGIPASFQIVPEKRYSVEPEFLEEIRRRGFEVNVQDLNHDGNLFRDEAEFERRVKKINSYGREYQAAGFRSAILYRKQEWFDRLEFEYDMSVPSVAHLDPQGGGCCTMMPYFVGELVELPVTTTQDHSLFNVLDDCTMTVWKQQAELILKHHGLMNFIIHPDYIRGARAQSTYKNLLSSLASLRRKHGVWVALPRDVSSWWRQRDCMVLTRKGENWSVEGEGSEKARVAFATLQGDRLVYSFADQPAWPLADTRAANSPIVARFGLGGLEGRESHRRHPETSEVGVCEAAMKPRK